MIHLWTKHVDGAYWVHWDDHDDPHKGEGEVVNSNTATNEQAIATLTEMHEALVAAGIAVRKTERKNTPRLDISASTDAIEAVTGRKLGHRP